MQFHPMIAEIVGTIGMVGLLCIVGSLIYLFWRRKKLEKQLAAFYAKHNFIYPKTLPKAVFENLEVGKGSTKWHGYEVSLKLKSGQLLPIHWWRGCRTEALLGHTTKQTTLHFFLAISFPTNSVADSFIEQVKTLSQAQPTTSKEKLSRFFILDTKTPFRADILSDGTFLLIWRSLDRADIYEDRLHWLAENVITKPTPPPMKEADPIKIPYSELVSTAPPEHQEEIRLIMSILTSMSWNYHDTKAHPNMSFEDHAEDRKLTPEQAERVKKAIQPTGYSYKELGERGFPIGYPSADFSDAADVTFPHRNMIYMVAADLYLDFAEPGKVYVYSTS